MDILKKCTMEFVGTFAIVFVGCGAIAVNGLTNGDIGPLGIAVVFGTVVMAVVYAGGHVSGAHYNPAVTIAFAVTQKFPLREIVPYLLAQCAGALVASYLHQIMFVPLLPVGETLLYGVTTPMNNSFLTVVTCEAVISFLLMYVVMAVATDYRAVGNAAGIAIGGVIMVNALVFGPICGASMNPARSLGPAVISGEYSFLIGYIIGPIVGAILGAVLYDFARCQKNKDQSVNGCC